MWVSAGVASHILKPCQEVEKRGMCGVRGYETHSIIWTNLEAQYDTTVKWDNNV